MEVSPFAGKPADPSILIDVSSWCPLTLPGDQIRPRPRRALRLEPPGIAVARSTTPSTKRTYTRDNRKSLSVNNPGTRSSYVPTYKS